MTELSTQKLIDFEHSSLYGVKTVNDQDAYGKEELKYMYSSYLRGEEFAVRTAQRALASTPQSQYLQKLLNEESSHVALFRAYLESEFGGVADLELPFEEMLSAADQASPEIALLVLHTVIEPFGLGSLSTIVQKLHDRELQQLTEMVIADEVNHIQLPEQNPDFFEKVLTERPAEVAAWLDLSVTAMSDSACPKSLYRRYFSEEEIPNILEGARRSHSVTRQSRSVFSVLSRVRRKVPQLAQNFGSLKDLMSRSYAPGSFNSQLEVG